MGQGGNIAMSNATSYDWNLTHQHSYQMNTWSFPEKISAGTQGSCYIEFSEGIFETTSDDGGEAQYTLSGTNFSFTIQARSSSGFTLQLYLDNIEFIGYKQNSTINLGWDHNGTIGLGLTQLVNSFVYISHVLSSGTVCLSVYLAQVKALFEQNGLVWDDTVEKQARDNAQSFPWININC